MRCVRHVKWRWLLLAMGLALGCGDEPTDGAQKVAPDGSTTAGVPDAESDVPPGDDEGPTGDGDVVHEFEITVSFFEPKNGQVVTGLVSIEVHADSVRGIADLVFDEPSGLVDQNPAADIAAAKWDTSGLEDGVYTIAARATDGDGKSQTGSVTVNVANQSAGQLTGRAALYAGLADLPVTVTAYDDFTVGAPIGAGQTGPGGEFTVEIAPPTAQSRVLVTVGDALTTTAVLSDGQADNVMVTGLTTLAIVLASRLVADGQSDAGALALATQHLNAHLKRPESVDAVYASPLVGAAEPASQLSGLFHLGLWLQAEDEAQIDGELELLSLLAEDLSDGVFDGHTGDELVSSKAGWLLTTEVTRFLLAERVWEAAVGADGPDGLTSGDLDDAGGFLWAVSTDDGPLYPDDEPPTPFDPNPAGVKFVDPTPANGSFHNAPWQVVVELAGGILISADVDGQAIELPATIDPAGKPDGPLVVSVIAMSELGSETTVTRTFHVDYTGPSVVIEAPADGALLLQTDFTLEAQLQDAGAGTAQFEIKASGGNNLSVGGVADGLFTKNIDINKGAPGDPESPYTLTLRVADALDNWTEVPLTLLVDLYGPIVTITAPQTGLVTGDATVMVSGTALDAQHALASVQVDNGAAKVSAAVDGDSWSATVELVAGDNAITAVATDIAEQVGAVSAPVVVTRDAEGPELAVTAPPANSFVGPGDVSLEGTAADALADVSSVSLTLGELEPATAALDGANWSATVGPIDAEDDGQTVDVTVEGADGFGNVATVLHPLTVDGAGPTITPQPISWYPKAGAWTASFDVVDAGSGVAQVDATGPVAEAPSFSGTGDTWLVKVQADNAMNEVVLMATDEVGNSSAPASVFVGIDTEKPALTPLISPFPGAKKPTHYFTTTLDAYTFTGTATDQPSGVESMLAFCGNDKAEIQHETGQTISWSLTCSNWDPVTKNLQAAMAATDYAGNKSAVPTVEVFLDDKPPQIDVISPTEGTWISPQGLLLTGAVADKGGYLEASGVVGLTVDGVDTAFAGGSFVAPITAPDKNGPFTVVMTAIDALGQSVTSTLTIKYDDFLPIVKLNIAAVDAPDAVPYQAAEVLWWGDVDSAAITCTASDGGSGLKSSCLQLEGGADCVSSPTAVSLSGTPVVADCTGVDKAGNVKSVVNGVAKDVTPPELSFTVDTYSKDAYVELSAEAVDTGCGVKLLTWLQGDTEHPFNDVIDGKSVQTLFLDGPGTHNFMVLARDNLGNVVQKSFSVLYDPDPPKITPVESAFHPEKGMAVSFDGLKPQFADDTELTQTNSCEPCWIRKFVSRLRYSQGADLGNNNLPHFDFHVVDLTPGAELVAHYRYMKGDGSVPMTEWKPIEDLDDTLADNTFRVPFALDAFTEGDPTAYDFSDENTPVRLEFKVADKGGDQATKSRNFSVEWVAPPMPQTDMPTPDDGANLTDFPLSEHNTHQLFAGDIEPRVLVLRVSNPWEQDMVVGADPSHFWIGGKWRRPYLATTSQPNCIAGFCQDTQCKYAFWDEGVPNACLSPITAQDIDFTLANLIAGYVLAFDAAGEPVEAEPGGGFEVPAGGAIDLHWRLVLNGKGCKLRTPVSGKYRDAAGASFDATWHPFDNECSNANPLLASATCTVATSDCGGTTLRNAGFKTPRAISQLRFFGSGIGKLPLWTQLPSEPSMPKTEFWDPDQYEWITTDPQVTSWATSPYSPFGD